MLLLICIIEKATKERKGVKRNLHTQREAERERERAVRQKRDLPYASSLSKCACQPEFSQVKDKVSWKLSLNWELSHDSNQENQFGSWASQITSQLPPSFYVQFIFLI